MLLQKISVSLSLAKEIVRAAEAEAVRAGLAVSIAVVNDAGQLVHFSKMDGSSNVSGEMAVAKAQHAVNYRRDTKVHEDALKQGQLRVLALPHTVSIEGGTQLLFNENLIGAIGVSGAAAPEDGAVAAAGVAFLAGWEGETRSPK